MRKYNFKPIRTGITPLILVLSKINCYNSSCWQIPNLPLKFSNWFASRALVKMSASCSSVATCSNLIVFSSTRSLIKWCLMSICLVLLCWMGFLEMLSVLRLSQYNVITSCVTLYSVSICFIQIIWEQLLPAAMYSASAVERDTQFCFLLNQETRLFPKKKHPLEVLFLSLALPAQSASQ